MTRNIKIIIVFIGLFLAIKPMSDLIFNCSGYCQDQGRYLSDKELIDSAVLNVINTSRKINLDGYRVDPNGWLESGYSRPQILREAQAIRVGESIPSLLYRNLDDFYRTNPNCCQLMDGISGESPFSTIPLSYRLSGKIFAVVRIFYIAGVDVQNNNQPLHRIEYRFISNCGEVITEPKLY